MFWLRINQKKCVNNKICFLESINRELYYYVEINCKILNKTNNLKKNTTNNMCSEGLDISTLSTLIFVTPKTDIVQSVGRILRTKDNNPIVIDIIDSHQIFQNQWKKRQSYYKQENYKIRSITSLKYISMILMKDEAIKKSLPKCLIG